MSKTPVTNLLVRQSHKRRNSGHNRSTVICQLGMVIYYGCPATCYPRELYMIGNQMTDGFLKYHATPRWGPSRETWKCRESLKRRYMNWLHHDNNRETRLMTFWALMACEQPSLRTSTSAWCGQSTVDSITDVKMYLSRQRECARILTPV